MCTVGYIINSYGTVFYVFGLFENIPISRLKQMQIFIFFSVTEVTNFTGMSHKYKKQEIFVNFVTSLLFLTLAIMCLFSDGCPHCGRYIPSFDCRQLKRILMLVLEF